MALEIWVAAFGTSSGSSSPITPSKNLIYRFSAATGNPVGSGAVSSSATAQMQLGAPYKVNHGGVIIPRGTTVGAFCPDGQRIVALDGTAGETIYGASSQSGNVITAGGPATLSGYLSQTRKMIYVSTGASAEEWWSWDGETGVTQRFLASTGARITTGGSYFFHAKDTAKLLGFQTGDYLLTAGTDIACVTVS